VYDDVAGKQRVTEYLRTPPLSCERD
jgi:hypothetical protein